MSPATIYLVDDEPSIREAMSVLLRVAGYRVETFADGEDFLTHPLVEHGCIVLDLRLPGANGLEILETLEARRNRLPVIILTAYGDIPISVQAMRAGASDFIQKAAEPGVLLARIDELLRLHAANHDPEQEAGLLRVALNRLSEREREILSLAARDFDSHEMARHLGISLRTVEAHRSNIAKKLGVENFAALFRIAARHKLPLP